MAHIVIIIGSVRPGRFGTQPATWIMDLPKELPGATFEVIDLADIQLPFLDESTPPSAANGKYEHRHTTEWSKIIDKADGYIFVTGEYNHGIPASLKNAIDFLAGEWYYKPVSFVSYGANGGGVRAVEHLRGVVGWLRMYAMHDEVAIRNYWGQLDDTGQFQPTAQQNDDAMRLIGNLVFWADKLALIRKELKVSST